MKTVCEYKQFLCLINKDIFEYLFSSGDFTAFFNWFKIWIWLCLGDGKTRVPCLNSISLRGSLNVTTLFKLGGDLFWCAIGVDGFEWLSANVNCWILGDLGSTFSRGVITSFSLRCGGDWGVNLSFVSGSFRGVSADVLASDLSPVLSKSNRNVIKIIKN